MSLKILTKSSEDTVKVALRLAVLLKKSDVLGLSGELGTGKTTFVQGIAMGLGIPKHIQVSSPTFALINEYSYQNGILYHMDFYRLNDAAEAMTLGLEDYFGSAGISVIEWFERCQGMMPKDFLEIFFSYGHENATEERLIEFVAHGHRSDQLLQGFISSA